MNEHTLNEKLKKLLDFNLISHYLSRNGKRKEWYEFTEKGRNTLKIVENMKWLVDEGKIPDNIVDSLIKDLGGKDSTVRWNAAIAPGAIGSEKAVDHLIEALKDKNSDVRGRTAYAPGAIGSEKAVDHLIEALKDKDSIIRGRAAEALEGTSKKLKKRIILIFPDRYAFKNTLDSWMRSSPVHTVC